MLITAMLVANPAWAGSAQDDARVLAQDYGVPAEVLELKVREGEAKGIPTARITTAVAAMAERMRKVGEILPGEVSVEEYRVGERALAGGVAESSIAELADLGSEVRAAAISRLAALVEQGISEAVAVRAVAQAAASPSPAQALDSLSPGQLTPAPVQFPGPPRGSMQPELPGTPAPAQGRPRR